MHASTTNRLTTTTQSGRRSSSPSFKADPRNVYAISKRTCVQTCKDWMAGFGTMRTQCGRTLRPQWVCAVPSPDSPIFHACSFTSILWWIPLGLLRPIADENLHAIHRTVKKSHSEG